MSQRSDLEERFGGGVKTICTPGWGVRDSDGVWDVYHVTEDEARTQYMSSVHLVALFAEINTDELVGEEHAQLVAVKPAQCVHCGKVAEAEFESGEHLPPDEWEWTDTVPESWASAATCPATCLECYRKLEEQAQATAPAGELKYNDQLDGELQVDTEEMIASIIFEFERGLHSEDDCAALGRKILLAVVQRIAPQMLTYARKEDPT